MELFLPYHLLQTIEKYRQQWWLPYTLSTILWSWNKNTSGNVPYDTDRPPQTKLKIWRNTYLFKGEIISINMCLMLPGRTPIVFLCSQTHLNHVCSPTFTLSEAFTWNIPPMNYNSLIILMTYLRRCLYCYIFVSTVYN